MTPAAFDRQSCSHSPQLSLNLTDSCCRLLKLLHTIIATTTHHKITQSSQPRSNIQTPSPDIKFNFQVTSTSPIMHPTIGPHELLGRMTNEISPHHPTKLRIVCRRLTKRVKGLPQSARKAYQAIHNRCKLFFRPDTGQAWVRERRQPNSAPEEVEEV